MPPQPPNPSTTALDDIFLSIDVVADTHPGTPNLFVDLCLFFFRNDDLYQSRFCDILPYSDWAAKYHLEAGDHHAIDLVARLHPELRRGHAEYVAIRCLSREPTSVHVSRDSVALFLAASEPPIFAERILVLSCDLPYDVHVALQRTNKPFLLLTKASFVDSQIDWSKWNRRDLDHAEKKPIFEPFPYQLDAIDAVLDGFRSNDRGQLRMACGTGKTLTSLRAVEKMAQAWFDENEEKPNIYTVAFFVPSLALISQSLNVWSQQKRMPMRCFAICSDNAIGQTNLSSSDDPDFYSHIYQLAIPASTDAKSVAIGLKNAYDGLKKSNTKGSVLVVFSTYQSIEILSQVQKKYNFQEFNIAICDEAHRTTGATFEGSDESAFIRVHDQDFIKFQKRLYMTGTPRIFGEKAKESDGVKTLASMDDEVTFGPLFYTINFRDAVDLGRLCPYKVVILTVDLSIVHQYLEDAVADDTLQIPINEAGMIVGAWKGLTKQGFCGEASTSAGPMRRAIAYASQINPSGRSSRIIPSTRIAEQWEKVVARFAKKDAEVRLIQDENAVFPVGYDWSYKAQHIDGSMGAKVRDEKLEWLAAVGDSEGRILCNVRCLSEGVDVPALDAVIFIAPRRSEVEIVQTIGRVMRKAPGKEVGYIIVPVVYRGGDDAGAMVSSGTNFETIWAVINALRAHDPEIAAKVNQMDLTGTLPRDLMEVVTVEEVGLHGELGAIERLIASQVVKKCADRNPFVAWANDVAEIVKTLIEKIWVVLSDSKNRVEIQSVSDLMMDLRDDLNDAITQEEVVEMLAQHMVTGPVFNALFENYDFMSQNPVSRALSRTMELLKRRNPVLELESLEEFYREVRRKVKGIERYEHRQKVLKDLYGEFFGKAFPKTVDRLGIVYTPIEIVDFINKSADEILRKEFNKCLSDKNVHILDPFTGTGTFITRLIQDQNLIPIDRLEYKYKNELHANEIVPLAYYLAAINIESAYHEVQKNAGVKENEYLPFKGICFADTFTMCNNKDVRSNILSGNSERRNIQQNLDISVILGNPPYSSGQVSANDNNENVCYPSLDKRICDTYAKFSTAVLQRNLYDSYVRAIRWASDRLNGKGGIIGFVTNGSFLESFSADGMRKCLAEEFSSLYIFNLRGNTRTSGERARKEGGQTFGSGCRSPIAITFLVKKTKSKGECNIYLHDIGDYLSREEKLNKIRELGSVDGISKVGGWDKIVPNAYYDWIQQREDEFENFVNLVSKKKTFDDMSIFNFYSTGLVTSRDAWVYNFSKDKLETNIRSTIKVYNQELDAFKDKYSNISNYKDVGEKVTSDTSKISWSRGLKKRLIAGKKINFNRDLIRVSIYRPFQKTLLYYDKSLVEITSKTRFIFPDNDKYNLLICINNSGASKQFSSLMLNLIPDFQLLFNDQCFPLYYYENDNSNDNDFLDQTSLLNDHYVKKSAINKEALKYFQDTYSEITITDEDLFYYIYGLFYSHDYKKRFASNLSKSLPRIPRVATADDFTAFSDAGRRLGALHVNYDSVAMPDGVEVEYGGVKFSVAGWEALVEQGRPLPLSDDVMDPIYKVGPSRMRYGGSRGSYDRSVIRFNRAITVRGIPLAAHDFLVNGRSAIDWVIDRWRVRVDRKSSVTNDPNDWSREMEGRMSYPLELLLRVVTVSLETMKIVNNLPKLVLVDDRNGAS